MYLLYLIMINAYLVSPPSRRDRGNRKDVTESTPVVPAVTAETSERKPRRSANGEHNGPRKFDRHSGTGIV